MGTKIHYLGAMLIGILSVLSVPVVQAQSVKSADISNLPTPSGLLAETKLKTKHTLKISETMNFEDCLKYDFKPKFSLTCKLGGVIPIFVPAAELNFKYQEPTAIVEAGCIRGESMLQNAQGSASRILTGGLKKPEKQRCMAPLQSNHGQATRYFDDTLVWATTLGTRFQSSGDTLDVLQSYTCEILKNAGTIASAFKVVKNINISNFKSIGDSIKSQVKGAWNSLKDGVAQLKNTLTNLSATVKTQISGAMNSIKGAVSSVKGTIGNLKTTVANSFKNFQTTVGSYAKKLSEISPSTVISNLKAKGSAFLDKTNAVFAKLGTGSLDITKDLKGVLSIPGISSLPIVSEMNQVVSQLESVGSTYAALEGTETGTLSLSGIKTGLEGVVSNGGKVISSLYNQTADMLESTFIVLDENYDQDRYASNGGITSVPTGTISSLVQKLREAADEAEAADAEIQKYAGALADLEYIINQLGGEEEVKDVPRYVTDANGNLTVDGFLETGGSQTATRRALESYESNMSLLDETVIRAEAWQKTLQTAQMGEVCRAYFDFEKGVKTVQNMYNKVTASDFVTGIYPEATYLPMGYTQYVQEGQPGPSCPLSSGGFMLTPQVNDPNIKTVQNCERVCETSSDGSSTNCKLEPKSGYHVPAGATCNSNRLSDFKIEGYYPSCNGLKRVMMFDKELGKYVWTGRFEYIAALDHRQILENKKVQALRDQINAVRTKYEEIFAKTKRLMLAKSITVELCEPYRPLEYSEEDLTVMGPEEKAGDIALRMVMERQLALGSVRPDFGMLKASNPANTIGLRQAALEVPADVKSYSPSGVLSNAIRNSRGAAGETFLGGMKGTGQETMFNNATRSMEEIADLLNKGALKQRVVNSVQKYYPFGLNLVFNSADTTWQKPRLSKQSLVVKALYSTPAGMIPWMICSGSSALGSLTGGAGGEGSILGSINQNLGCYGSWGTADEHGMNYNQNRFKGKMLVARRGVSVGEKGKGIQPNLMGMGQFNMEYPYLHENGQGPYTKAAISSFAAKGGHSHKGSGCYDYGTTDTSWYTPNEAGSANEALDQVNVLNAANNVGASVKKLNPLTQGADLGGDQVVATNWKKTACKAKFTADAVATVIAGGFPEPCTFKMLY